MSSPYDEGTPVVEFFVGFLLAVVFLSLGAIIGDMGADDDHTRECLALMVELDDAPTAVVNHCMEER